MKYIYLNAIINYNSEVCYLSVSIWFYLHLVSKENDDKPAE